MKKYWMKFQELGIAKKILIWLLVMIILPILLIVAIAYSLSTITIKNQTSELIEANQELSVSNVQNFFKNYDNIIQQIYTNSAYINNLEPINSWDNSHYYTAKHTIHEMLQDIVYINNDILGICIVGKNRDTCFYDSISDSVQNSFCFDLQDIPNSELVHRAFAQKNTIYSKSYHKTESEYGDKEFFYIAHQLTDFNNYQRGAAGCVIFCVDEAALKRVYNYENTKYSITFIINLHGDVISFPDQEQIGDNIFENEVDNMNPEELETAATSYIREVRYSDGKNLEVNAKSILNGQFYVINVQNVRYALKNVRFTSLVIILIGLFAAILSILLSIYFSESTDRSVKRILTGMDAANKGEREVRILADGKDEFARISRHFNRMMDEIEKTEGLEKEALIREKNAEIKSLEAQINPHFLYNTLDTINWVAIERKEYTISRMLTSLATILRYSVHKSNGVVTIRDELEYLKKYVYLQQQRFNYSFLCTLHADEPILNCKIHKLLIQPLLENVIVHAFPGRTGMDEVNIDIKSANKEKIRIIVKDNGKGMDAGLVNMFNNLDYRQERIESSIGVRNVITRIKLYYGESGSFHIESDEMGTCTELIIPYEDREEDTCD